MWNKKGNLEMRSILSLGRVAFGLFSLFLGLDFVIRDAAHFLWRIAHLNIIYCFNNQLLYPAHARHILGQSVWLQKLEVAQVGKQLLRNDLKLNSG